MIYLLIGANAGIASVMLMTAVISLFKNDAKMMASSAWLLLVSAASAWHIYTANIGGA